MARLAPHQVWQEMFPPGTLAAGDGIWPAALPDGRQIALPVRILPGNGRRAVASLILNQASFTVLDALAEALTEAVRPHAPDLVVAVPTLGLALAEGVARRLGHSRLVALSTSRKFWYDAALSEPLSSITTPDQAKHIYLDPRMLPLLAGRRVALVDDVASSGTTLGAVLRLLDRVGVRPVVAGFAMLQGQGWHDVALASPGLAVVGALTTPRLVMDADCVWRPE